MTQPSSNIALAVHGGAGALARELISPAREQESHAALASALTAGHAVLRDGGSSVEAVAAAVVVLEDCPLFNAGKGSVLSHDGHVRTDAAIMEGKHRRAGAATNVTLVRNPVLLARRIMGSVHVFLSGEGAVEFAREAGLVFETADYFVTPERYDEWQRALAPDDDNESSGDTPSATKRSLPAPGTVGAVARDSFGTLAAATSTGGMLLKRWHRVGDSPVIGAGTYADNSTCAVSATGYGEIFMRAVAAHDVAARMKYLSEDVNTATRAVLAEVGALGGDGGLIAIDPHGNIAMNFNAQGMYRGCIDVHGRTETKIW